MMDLSKILSADAQEAIRQGKYSLLLGAGASHGAMSKDGRPLPSGDGFGSELIARYGLNVVSGTSLPYVWEAAVAKAESEDKLRLESTVPRFRECLPAQYHSLIPTFAWRRIFTFNVDDVIPVAYRRAETSLQSVSSIHFDDEYSDVELANDQGQIVFLHGSEQFPAKPLVFGPPAYAATVTRQHTWWHVFADSFVTQPFIVIGATLREPDFETYLVQKRRPHLPFLPPSLFVSTSIDDAGRALCRRFGLEPVESTGEQFLQELSKLVVDREKISSRYVRRISSASLITALRETPHLATLARQYVVVNNATSWPTSERAPESFFEGYEPVWDDIRNHQDVQLSIESALVKSVDDFVSSQTLKTRVAVVCLEGTAGSGKTTALMRASAQIAAKGLDTLYFLGRERLRYDVLHQLIAALPAESTIVVAIDDLGEYANQVKRFVLDFPTKGARCLLLCALRSSRRIVVERTLEKEVPIRFEKMRLLERPEALELATKLRAAAKLGRLAGQTDAQLVDSFVGKKPSEWAGQLLAILLEVVPGGKFEDKLISEWASLSTDALRRFYGAICLSSTCGGLLRSALAYRVDLPPDGSANLKLVESAFQRRSGHEEAVHRRADHRVFAGGGRRGISQGAGQEARL